MSGGHSCCIHPAESWDHCDACTADFNYSTGSYDPTNHDCAGRDHIYTSNNDVDPIINVYVGTHIHVIKCDGCLATLDETIEGCTPDGNWQIYYQPTCSSDGMQMCQCSLCGQICYDLIPATDHDWRYTGNYEGMVGEYEYECTSCGIRKWSTDRPDGI